MEGSETNEIKWNVGKSKACLMMSKAPLLSEGSTGRADCVTVTGVGHRVPTRMRPCAGLPTFGRARATRYRGTQDGTPTVAMQVFKADIPARVAVSSMTLLLTDMQPTREPLAADELALVFRVDTAHGEALVASTLAPLLATALAQLLSK